MPPTRSNYEVIAYPLWVLAIAHMLFAISFAASFFHQYQTAEDAKQALRQLQQKPVKTSPKRPN